MNVITINVKEPQNARIDLKLNALDHKKEKILVIASQGSVKALRDLLL
jgi:hypothetical protein